jgi:hypothetical protein
MKKSMKPLGLILVGNVGVVLGLVCCLTLLLIPFGIFEIIWAGKIGWKGVRQLFGKSI